MLVPCTCTECGKIFVVDVQIECFEEQLFSTEEDARKYIIDNIKIRTAEST